MRRDPPAGRAAVRQAVRTALAPTREALESSAIGLLGQMLPLIAVDLPPSPGRRSRAAAAR